MIDLSPETQSRLVTVIGRGHSGTRGAARWLMASGVHLGNERNPSEDFAPRHEVYHSARIAGRAARFAGDHRWDLSGFDEDPPAAWVALWEDFIHRVLEGGPDEGLLGWKVPETTLSWPWLARALPHARYVLWARDPRDSILKQHGTDDLSEWKVPAPSGGNRMSLRARSWLYQYQLITDTPRPERCIAVRLRDFVHHPAEQQAKLSELLGRPAAAPSPQPEAIGRYRAHLGWRDGGPEIQAALRAWEQPWEG